MKTRIMDTLIYALFFASVLHQKGWANDASTDWRSAARNSGIECSSIQTCDTEKGLYFLGHKAPDPITSESQDEVFLWNRQSGEIETCLDVKESERIFSGKIRPIATCFAVSPSERNMAIGRYKIENARTENNIVLVDLPQRKAKVCVANEMDNRGYFFSPDDRYLLYYAHPADAEFKAQGGHRVKSCSVNILDLATGETKEILPSSDIDIEVFQYSKHCAWSLDSKSVAFAVLRPSDGMESNGIDTEIHEFVPGSGKSREIASYRSMVQSLQSVDFERFIVATDKELDLVNRTTGKTHRIAEGRAIRDVRLSEGKILFSSRLGEGSKTTPREVLIPSGE